MSNIKNANLDKGAIDFDRRSQGVRTKEMLIKNNIVSPDISNLIEIIPGLKLQAPHFKNDNERKEWIEKKRKKFSKQ